MGEIVEDTRAAAIGRETSQPLANFPPLCVDLDGTLIRSDMLIEGALALATSMRFYRALLALLGLRDGNRAAFKRAIAAASNFDPALLPYHQSLLSYLRAQKAFGRRLILVTAAEIKVAQAIAAHLGLFDEVIASDGTRNLKGRQKAVVLLERFGPNGFCYVGDSPADLPVWQVEQSGILVNTRKSTAAAARAVVSIETEFNDRASPWFALLRAIRPHQWVKNLLVFVPLFTSGASLDWRTLAAVALAFAAFSATASGLYLLNDLADLAADRRHPRKRQRPFASGAVSLQIGLAAAFGLVAAGVGLADFAGVLATVALYAILSVSYSLKLKELPLVDVFTLAALYSVRLVGGGEASGHRVSLWLLAFSSFLFLNLALVKRVAELAAASSTSGARIARRGYDPADTAILQMFGCSSAVAASLVFALFTQSVTTQERYASPALLWGIVPLALFWQCRIWLSTTRGYMDDDPIVYAARDWVSWLVALIAVTLVIAARLKWPGLSKLFELGSV